MRGWRVDKLSSNYTTRNLFEDLIKWKTCLMILIFSSYVKSTDPQVSRFKFKSLVCTRIVHHNTSYFSIVRTGKTNNGMHLSLV